VWSPVDQDACPSVGGIMGPLIIAVFTLLFTTIACLNLLPKQIQTYLGLGPKPGWAGFGPALAWAGVLGWAHGLALLDAPKYDF
jgi:hypothetical protein